MATIVWSAADSAAIPEAPPTRRRFTVRAFAAVLVLTAGCRTTRPAGTPFAPLTARTVEEARAQLAERAANFAGARSVMRVRAITPERTQSFRAQLIIHDRERMDLVVYTPIGTTAATIRANGDEIQFDSRVDASSWKGSAEEVARSFGFYGADLDPAETAMLLIGLPPRPDLDYEMTSAGIAGLTMGDISVRFDTPAFPARRAVVTRGPNRLEIEHVEVVASQ